MYRGVFSLVYTFYIILHSVWGVKYTYIYQKRYFLSRSPNHVAMYDNKRVNNFFLLFTPNNNNAYVYI